jgi:hypothetical protein
MPVQRPDPKAEDGMLWVFAGLGHELPDLWATKVDNLYVLRGRDPEPSAAQAADALSAVEIPTGGLPQKPRAARPLPGHPTARRADGVDSSLAVPTDALRQYLSQRREQTPTYRFESDISYDTVSDDATHYYYDTDNE